MNHGPYRPHTPIGATSDYRSATRKRQAMVARRATPRTSWALEISLVLTLAAAMLLIVALAEVL
ncbi:MAG TPA: hypothetical protein PKD09_15880 [Aggregatilinea sp.]|uniref:hypothetical protein n=1 Tax=Aggregatilinea sp. TaxID=2806333 RepID=UPI002CC21B08|nr:hypothetical protein [Aggregatilinea sp.]HML23133.1 hypothetical protein [Aggregatilinea sp.]